MGRSIPVWFVLFLLLLWALFTVAFGWTVRSTLVGNNPSGRLGWAAVTVASFPDSVKRVFTEISLHVTGDIQDHSIRTPRPAGADYAGFKPISTAADIRLDGVLIKVDPASTPVVGWRVVAGAFMVDGEIENAALLISPDLEVVRIWRLNEIPIGDMEPRPKHRKFLHGIEILKDGSLVFTFDSGVSLQRFDACGKRLWAIPGEYHHAVSLDDDGESVWALKGRKHLVRISVADGAVLREISIDDVIAANPMIGLLEIRRTFDDDLGGNSRNTGGTWLSDPLHFNDISPLPAAIAGSFDLFEPGDLLLSARSLNLIFVLDPDTLKIKWWRVGAVRRQHDPDWLPIGEISVFDNRMGRDASMIVEIDPETFETTTLLDGRQYDFYTRIRGKHQILGDG
ncbi:MAG: arylsulfotransferase family protein, partial [Planctomycetes bacterium]|nr:arylsulfotransferase family protein [Planctomycetota bacterium]